MFTAHQGQPRWPLSFWLLLAALPLALLLLLGWGLDHAEWAWPGSPASAADTLQTIVWQIRLPRLLFCLLTGLSLALAGALMQTLLGNPLAEPSLTGVSSGAALGAVLALWLGVSSYWALPLAGAAGALLMLLLLDGWLRLRGDAAQLLLAGLAMSLFTAAIAGLILTVADDATLRSFTFWRLGSLSGVGWREVALVTPLTLLAVAWLYHRYAELNLLLLGDDAAAHLGVKVASLRRQTVMVVALLTGALTALVGDIAFVGLVAPQLARLLVGGEHRRLLPVASLIGMWLLLLADWAAQTLGAPAELPLGLLTSLLGAPCLLVLILRQGKHQHA
jgi:iron complex transport system permease protein